MSELESAEQIMDEAFQCLESHDFAGAQKLGRQLLAMRYSGGFEVLALAYEQGGEPEKALNVLEEAVTVVPQIWSLWQLLGNMRSDCGDYRGAYEAYDRALTCPNANSPSILFNKSVVLQREKRYDDCLEALAQLSADEDTLRTQVLKLTVLNDLGRHQEALRLALDISTRLSTFDSNTSDFNYQCASLETGTGWALLASADEDDKERALAHLFRAVALDRTHGRALKIIRETGDSRSPEAQLLRLVVRGIWHQPVGDSTEPPVFMSTAEVVADDETEALNFVRQFEPAAVRESLTIDQWHALSPAADKPKGVYRLSGRVFVLDKGRPAES